MIDAANGCPTIKAGGTLITLGTVVGDEREVRVGISGFVACLGATWLTCVVGNGDGVGWRVTGTTGPRAIAQPAVSRPARRAVAGVPTDPPGRSAGTLTGFPLVSILCPACR